MGCILITHENIFVIKRFTLTEKNKIFNLSAAEYWHIFWDLLVKKALDGVSGSILRLNNIL